MLLRVRGEAWLGGSRRGLVGAGAGRVLVGREVGAGVGRGGREGTVCVGVVRMPASLAATLDPDVSVLSRGPRSILAS